MFDQDCKINSWDKKYFGQFSQKQMELSVSYGLWKLNELRSETRVFPTFYCNFLIIK